MWIGCGITTSDRHKPPKRVTVAIETELKPILSPRTAARLPQHPLQQRAALTRKHLRNTYYYTADLSLKQAHIAVCDRRIGRQWLLTIKSTEEEAGSLAVHMVRHSLNYVSWKRRPEVAADLKRIYRSATADEAVQRLGELEARGMMSIYRSANPGAGTGRG
jgi:inorganic triphosphatase YgiF